MFDEDKEQKDKFRYNVKLSDIDTNKVFYDKLTFVYLEMPKFDKEVEELTDNFEKWLYVLKNLGRLERLPDNLQSGIFKKLFKVAAIANLSPDEYEEYEKSLTACRDIKNSMDTAREEGKTEGKIEMAKEMLKEKEPIEKIIKYTKLSKEQIGSKTNDSWV